MSKGTGPRQRRAVAEAMTELMTELMWSECSQELNPGLDLNLGP